jgi:hypothetical protein
MSEATDTPSQPAKPVATCRALFDESQAELDPNGVERGMHVSILKWKSHFDRSWVGDVLHVVNVNPPFIVTNLRRKYQTSRLVIDVRDVALVRLREDFVEDCQVHPSTLPSNDQAEPQR